MKIELMLDSGAFSAWMHGESLDLADYISYLKANRDLVALYVNMDVLPGRPGKKPTPAQVEESAARSYDNLQVMKRAGLSPIPVFHGGERFEWLDRLIADGEPYIGLAPNNLRLMREKKKWLDLCFTRLTHKSGEPFVKTHGFGITTFSILFRYPWTTVDSTTWSVTPGLGRMIVPSVENGRFCYDRPPLHVRMSSRQSKLRDESYNDLGPEMQRGIKKFMAEVGVDVLDAMNNDEARRTVTLHYFMQLQKNWEPKRFSHRVAATFS